MSNVIEDTAEDMKAAEPLQKELRDIVMKGVHEAARAVADAVLRGDSLLTLRPDWESRLTPEGRRALAARLERGGEASAVTAHAEVVRLIHGAMWKTACDLATWTLQKAEVDAAAQ
jgi:hypothetical protein